MNDNVEIMSFKDENRNKIDLEVISRIELNGKKYIILGSSENEEEAYVFRYDIENGSEVLNLVEDSEEFLKVKKEYKKEIY